MKITATNDNRIIARIEKQNPQTQGESGPAYHERIGALVRRAFAKREERKDPSFLPKTIQAQLDRMGKGFMVPTISQEDYWEVTTSDGSSCCLPESVVGIPSKLEDGDDIGGEEGDESDKLPAEDSQGILSAMADYLPEGCTGPAESAKVHRGGFVCRMSAPGYMDCTDWEGHKTARECAESLISNYGE